VRFEDYISKTLFLCASFSTIVILLITVFLLRQGIFVLDWDFVTGMIWSPHRGEFGIFPILMGSLYVTVGSVIIATLIGIPSAIYLSEFSPFWFRNIIKSTVEVIVGIPSVVIGFFGVFVLVPLIRNSIGGRGHSILAALIILSFMILPNIISLSEDSLRAVPRAYREASLALGATKWQTVRHVVLPTASSGIRASLILGAGRAIGETMAVLMVIGNPELPWIPINPLDMARTLPSTIAIEYGYAEWGSPHMYSLFAMGVVLFFIVVTLNFIATFVIKGEGIESS
jgi:phosphate transport system permease protein